MQDIPIQDIEHTGIPTPSLTCILTSTNKRPWTDSTKDSKLDDLITCVCMCVASEILYIGGNVC